jgi:alkylation response protein AidB-like acyl-CoA dehydrogenase
MRGTHTVRAFLDPTHEALARDLMGFVAREIDPLPHADDDAVARLQAREIAKRLGASGIGAYAVPARGRALPDLRSCALVREALAAASPLADAVFALQCLGATPIALFGTEAQKAAWLPEVASGRAIAAFAMTEPDAGSDVAAIRTTARRDGDDYVLDGQKTLISNAGIADFYAVFASTDPQLGGKGLSTFIVDARCAGFRFVRPLVQSEPHPLGEIAFDACRVPASARLGEEGEGLRVGLATLDLLRATVAAAACGMARCALDLALEHARTRQQFGRPIAEHQLVAQKLARMAIDLDASRLLTYRAAWEKDRGAERVTLESSMAKVFATEAAQRIVDDAVQICGGAGVLRDHPVDRLYRAVRSLRIYEGTTEIQHLVIAKQLGRDRSLGGRHG